MANAPFQTVGGLASMSMDGLRVDRIRVGRKMDEAEDSAQISSRE